MPSVSLATTLHDSTGWTIDPLSETTKVLGEYYDSRLTLVTDGTKPDVVEALRNASWVVVEPRSRVGVQYITDSRRSVLRASLERGSDFTHLVDMDRVLHWALSYPEVPLSGLVDLGAAHLLLDQLDLLGYTHGVMRTAAHKKNVASKHLFLLNNRGDIALERAWFSYLTKFMLSHRD